MNIDLLKFVNCPICQSKNWKFEGYKTDQRYTHGAINCDSSHSFNICQDIFRLDKEKSNEEMIFLDHEITGYPKEIGELERIDFLEATENSLKKLNLSSKPLAILGNQILFFRYIHDFENLFVVVNENEGILRQIQNLTVQKRIFPNSGFIRSTKWNPNEEYQIIRFLDSDNPDIKMNKGDIVYSIVKKVEENMEAIWESEENFSLIKTII